MRDQYETMRRTEKIMSAALARCAIDLVFQHQRLRVRNLVGCHEPWACRREPGKAFRHGDADLGFHFRHLQLPSARVIEDRVARHVGKGVLLADAQGRPADDRGQFDLVIDRRDTRCKFGERGGKGRHFHFSPPRGADLLPFFHMAHVVPADGDEFARPRQWRTGRDIGQRRRLSRTGFL